MVALEKELPTMQRSLYVVFEVWEDSDFAPTTQGLKAATETQRLVDEWIGRWEVVKAAK